jgi:hypothetical protein
MVVKTWGTSIAEEVGKPLPDCSRCRRPDSANERKSWGCDAPAKKAIFTTGCSRCFGGDADCPDCEDGVTYHKRCPTTVMGMESNEMRRSAGRAVRSYMQFDSRGVMPGAGGFEDQSPQFGQICDVIDHERGRLEGQRAEHRNRERKRAHKKQPQKPNRQR